MLCGINWKEYNEQLVRRGEILFSIHFLKNWNEEIEKMNEGKQGLIIKFFGANLITENIFNI